MMNENELTVPLVSCGGVKCAWVIVGIMEFNLFLNQWPKLPFAVYFYILFYQYKKSIDFYFLLFLTSIVIIIPFLFFSFTN